MSRRRFALASGFAGVYQFDFQAPLSAQPGAYSFTCTVNGLAPPNPPVFVIVPVD